MLKVRNLTARYGTSQVLFGMDFEAARGECITLIGRNGMGKSTTVRSLLGMLRTHEGMVEFDGAAIGDWPSYRIAQAGIGLVPEMRQIFPTLTVRENLVATRRAPAKGAAEWTLERVYALFPRLKERRTQTGGTMSGGEQQMLAIARALMARPRVLLLDEPSMGLAPMIVQQIFSIITEINQQGTTVLLVEQNAQQALQRANRAYVLETGRIVRADAANVLLGDESVRAAYLGAEIS